MRATSMPAARSVSSLNASPEDVSPQRESEQRVAGSGEIVDHHAETVLERAIELPDRSPLRDVEEAEENKRNANEKHVGADEVEDQQEGDDLVPRDRGVVGDAEV